MAWRFLVFAMGLGWGCATDTQEQTVEASRVVHGALAAAVAPPDVVSAPTKAAPSSIARTAGKAQDRTPNIDRMELGEGIAADAVLAQTQATSATGRTTSAATRQRGARAVALKPTASRHHAVGPVTRGTAGRATAHLGVDTMLRRGLTGDQIWQTVGAAMGQVRACYERSLKSNPDLEGRMVTLWEVQPDGTVANAHVKGAGLGDPELSRCVERRVARWRFPKAARATPVEFPFTLRPSR